MQHDSDDNVPSEPLKSRKTYQAPRLTIYGDLPRLAMMAKPGSRGDGSGVPKTKR